MCSITGLLAALMLGSGAVHGQTSPLKLKVATSQTGAQATVWLADIYGYYKQQGLDVEVINFRNPADMIPAGISGAVNLINSGIEQPALLAQRGGVAPWRGMVATYGASAFSIVIQPSLNIKPGDFKALKGLKFGMSGFGRPGHSVAKSLLKDAGLDPENDVTYVEIPPGPEGIVAWERRIADVSVVNEPVTSALMARKTAKMFVDLREGKNGALSQVSQSVVLAPVSLINSERSALERFVSANCQAAKRGRQNPEEAARLLSERWGSNTAADPEVIKAGIVASAKAWKSEIPEASTIAWFKLLVDSKSLKAVPKFTDVVDTSFSKFWTC
jgi:ABC-type nitrate/sulfonate/bicarbonate transport system substrate-binding protein